MKYDIAIIGGGPAGLMAAARASEVGARVILLEKNAVLGRKLLLTGGGRCNITNNIENPRLMATAFGVGGKFLAPALRYFGVKEIKAFLINQGVKLKVEKNNQVFPRSDQAKEVLAALLKVLDKFKVQIKVGATVKKIVQTGSRIEKVILTDGQEILANNYIVATGGQSYAATGSTGDGYQWLAKLGHRIIPPRPALAPLVVREKFIKKLEGLSLHQVKINLWQNQKKIASLMGDMIFTATGVSGPAILNLSRLVAGDNWLLKIDLLPEIDSQALDRKFQLTFHQGRKILKNALESFLPPKLIPVLGDLATMDLTKPANAVTRLERRRLIECLKSFTLNIKTVANFNHAMITTGGVDLKEIDPASMRSKIINNLFIVGEILDLDGPTGGYNLQICWSTGYLAGEKASAH